MRIPARCVCLGLLLLTGCGSWFGVGSLPETEIRRAATHRDRAGLKLSEGQLALAIREYGNSIKINPYDPEAHFGLGEALRLKGRFDESEAAFERAVALDPEHHDALLNMVVLDLQRENWERAIERATRLIDDPTFLNPARGYVNRGWAYFSSGKLDEAEADFREALTVDSSLYQAYLNLGIVLYEKDEVLDSLRAFDRVIEILGTRGEGVLPYVEAETRFRIAQARVKLGQREKALAELRVAADRGGSGAWGEKAREYLSVLE